MPKPTTHTDVLVPRPSEDNPTARAARVSLVSNHDAGPGETRVESVEVIQSNDRTVVAHSEIQQTVGGPSLRLRLRVTAKDAEDLEIQGVPNKGAAQAPQAPHVEQWAPPRFQELKVEVEGDLNGTQLSVSRSDPSATESELELKDGSILHAKVLVSLS